VSSLPALLVIWTRSFVDLQIPITSTIVSCTPRSVLLATTDFFTVNEIDEANLGFG
jgi:hypothetical protein